MGGESVFIQSGNLLLVHWKDKRDVYMMSLIHENGVTEIQCRPGDKVTKPNMIIAYNKYMGGVDKSMINTILELLFGGPEIFAMVETYLVSLC